LSHHSLVNDIVRYCTAYAYFILSIPLGKELGLSQQALAEVYDVAQLRRIGCTSDSYELGALFSNDLAAHACVFILDLGQPAQVLEDMPRYFRADAPL
jgi:hypothetical protein